MKKPNQKKSQPKKSEGKKQKSNDENKGRISLFDNSYKEKEAHPDYTGIFEAPDGKKYRVACWLRKSKAGDEYISGVVEFDKEYFPKEKE